MLVHLLVAILIGLLAMWITDAIGPDHRISVVVGILVGVLVYVGAISL